MEARGLTLTSDEFILHLIALAVLHLSYNELMSSGKFKSCLKEAKFSVKVLSFNQVIM